MAKELAMLEENHIGRQIRRYFIHMEEQARKMMLAIPEDVTFQGEAHADYTYWLLRNGYSVSSSSYHRRIRRYPGSFVQHYGKWYISAIAQAYFQGFKKPQQLQLFDK